MQWGRKESDDDKSDGCPPNVVNDNSDDNSDNEKSQIVDTRSAHERLLSVTLLVSKPHLVAAVHWD